jgi:hypothetical protein
MAAPMVSGVAALMIAVNPAISAVDLRAQLLQHAKRTQLPVSAGYVDALDSVLATSTAVGSTTGQPPRLRILTATSSRRRTQLQVAVTGSRQAIRRYAVRLDNRKAAGLAARGTMFTVTVRRRSRRTQIDALDASGRRLATVKGAVKPLRKGKRGVNTGRGIGT